MGFSHALKGGKVTMNINLAIHQSTPSLSPLSDQQGHPT